MYHILSILIFKNNFSESQQVEDLSDSMEGVILQTETLKDFLKYWESKDNDKYNWKKRKRSDFFRKFGQTVITKIKIFEFIKLCNGWLDKFDFIIW